MLERRTMAVVKPRGRKWTYEDLFNLPDDRKRYEIIEGELYEMPSPNWTHQTVLMRTVELFLPAVRAISAEMLFAPIDVFMPGANPVQPDLLVLTDERLPLASERGVEGAPDLVVEVLSPSNPRHDLVVKRLLYARAGVREYWIVDPDERTVEVLSLDGNEYSTHVFAGGDELVTSTVLPGLSFKASEIFD